MSRKWHLGWGFSVLASLTACGGGGSGGGPVDEPGVVDPTPVSSSGLLKPVDSPRELGNSLREGLVATRYLHESSEPAVFLDGDLSAPFAPSEGAALEESYSRTNLQELGVDEADIVKYDGEILYVLDRGTAISPVAGDPGVLSVDVPPPLPEGPIPVEPDGGIGDGAPPLSGVDELASTTIAPTNQVIHLLRTDPAAPATTLVSDIDLTGSGFSVEGMYLVQNDLGKQLIAVGQDNPYVYWEFFASDYYWREGTTSVQSWGVTNPANTQLGWSVQIDGSLLASRRIGNVLYLVTRYSPTIEGTIAYPQTEEDIASNRDLVAAAELEDLTPDMVVNGGVPQELFSPGDCFIPNDEYEGLLVPPAGGSVISVTAIDLDAPDSIHTTCLNTYASGFYASTESIYLTANTADGTLIHKISLSGMGSQYRGSGEVPGYIGTSNPAFLMSESEGKLRVVSSRWDDREFPLPVLDIEEPSEAETADVSAVEDDGLGRHRLTILQESASGTALEVVAQLPNASRTAPIGKPDEEVYAARFMGDRAYVVTFRIIDPLYVLDLSDAQDPKIAGELELPGFSTLLQSIGENLLLGVGHEVPTDGQNITQGVKVALFDVGDPSAPVTLGQLVVGKLGSYSAALYDHHALTLLEAGDGYRVALPIVRHELEQGNGNPNDPWQYFGWSDTALYMFNIDPAAGSLSLAGKLTVDQPSPENPYSSLNDSVIRSVLHDDAVFYVNGPVVLAQPWGESN